MLTKINESIIPKLESIKGKELKYSALCKELNIPTKQGDSKTSQLSNLQLYCQLDKLTSPTRYVVVETYDKELLSVLKYNNKFQLLFDAMIYNTFLENKGKPLYLSHMEILKLFKEVNENFSYACNSEHMRKMGGEYIYMSEMSQTVYKILRQWTKRRIKHMEARKIILLSQGFRLYIPVVGKYGLYKVIHNVDIDSPEEKACQEIYNQAVEEIMPEGWGQEGKNWVAEWKWKAFEKRIAELVKERFDGKYIDMREIIIMRPPSIEWLESKVNKIYSEISNLTDINIEACRKIMETTQLDNNTGAERKKFIEINMALCPPIKFKEELIKKNEEEDK